MKILLLISISNIYIGENHRPILEEFFYGYCVVKKVFL